MGDPKMDDLLVENPIKMDDFGDTPILGNLQLGT